MEHHPLLPRPVEMQALEDGEIHQIVRGQAAIGVGLDIVRRVIAAELPGGCGERAGLGLVGPVGHELQHEIGMCRAALAEIDLDRVCSQPGRAARR